MRWTTTAPAKINVDLRMHGVRADGYHLLTTVLQSIALADGLTLTARPGPFALACDTAGVPTDARNLAWRGAAAMAAHLGVPLDGWQLGLEKRVPAEAGLGGGSADAAAAARLIAAAVGRSLDPAALAKVIAPIGADVAYFAWGGTMRGEGVGDQLTPLPDMPPASVLLVRPPFGVSTKAAYRWYDNDCMMRRTGGAGPGTATSPPWSGYVNDLESPVAARHPVIGTIVQGLREAGATLAGMSGSGSACFGMFDPGTTLPGASAGWPDGSLVWRTHTISRLAYVDLTAVCRG